MVGAIPEGAEEAMKFSAFKEFRASLASGLGEVKDYLGGEHASMLSELRAGLRKLTFGDNFETFTVQLTISANTEQAIRNEFRDGSVPSGWLAVRRNQYGLSVCDGDSSWDKNFVYLKNTHATQEATLTVIFFR